jgi:hypothetical protein
MFKITVCAFGWKRRIRNSLPSLNLMHGSVSAVIRCDSLWIEAHHPEYKECSVAEVPVQERLKMMSMPFDGYVETRQEPHSPTE